VELSPQSRDMKKINEILATTPEVRTEKVAELKKAIADGTYRVKTEDIADKMVQEMVFEFNR
jgi:negative regulator of flagellin synthesis FlgM